MEAGLCPKCKSDMIEWEGPEFEFEELWYEGYCEDCETEFQEIYKLDYITTEINAKHAVLDYAQWLEKNNKEKE